MSTLIIDNKMLSISQEGNRLKIQSAEQPTKSIPFSHFNKIVISADINIKSRLLRTLATKDISVILINPRNPEEYGLLQGSGHNDASRKITQYKASQTPYLCQQISQYLVTQKIAQQNQLLENAKPNHQQSRYAIIKAQTVLQNAQQKLKTNQPITTLRGIEGASAAAYFKAYRTLFSEKYKFTERNRRPPKDPINALLSLSYTLADGIACQRLQIKGLDLMIGFYHQLSWSRHSLSSDIIEPNRAIIDEWVRQLISQQLIRKKHFKYKGEACFLNKTARNIYYGEWEKTIKNPLIQETDKHIEVVMQIASQSNESR